MVLSSSFFLLVLISYNITPDRFILTVFKCTAAIVVVVVVVVVGVAAVGLGLVWLTYTSLHGGSPYDAHEGKSIVVALLGLGAVLLLSYAMIAWSDWKLKRWMLPPFAVMYVLYIFFVIYFHLA